VTTERLIDQLSRDAEPVRPVQGPWTRTARWFAAAALYAGLLAWLFTSSDDFSVNTNSRAFVAQQAAAVLMAVFAAVAAFGSVVPGYSPWVFLLPIVGIWAWLATLLAAIPAEWHSTKLAGLAEPHELLCVPTITLAALPPAAALAWMLRRGAPLKPGLSAALCVLAAAAMTNAVACVTSPHQSAMAVLAWHGSTLLALSGLTAGFGRAILPWHDPARRANGTGRPAIGRQS
jgi:hypothetical protein